MSRARRISDRSVVTPFEWKRRADISQPAGAERTAVEPPAPVFDAAANQQHLAALERDAFAKGFAQGEKAGLEAAAKRGDAMLRRLTQTLDEMTTLRYGTTASS